MFDTFLDRHRLKDNLNQDAKIFARECWQHKELEINDLQARIDQANKEKRVSEDLYLKECQKILQQDIELAELKKRFRRVKEILEAE